MIEELVFHLGDHKTGSTSVQDTLRVGNFSSAKSCRYLAVNTMHNSQMAKSVYPGTGPRDWEKEFSRLAKQVRSSDADVGIVSSEKFEGASPERLQQALEAYLPEYRGKIRFIAYVRSHADRVVSSWAERVKLGLFDRDLETYAARVLKNKRFTYAARFAQWQEVFGGQFTLRPMIRSELHQNCVVRDFLTFAFEGAEFSLLQGPAANETLSIEDLLILREWHRQLTEAAARTAMPVQRIKNMRSALGRQMGIEMSALPRRSASKPRLHLELVRRLQAAFHEDAAAVDRMFFFGAPLSRALEALQDKAQETAQPFDGEAYFDAASWRLVEGFCAFSTKMALKHPNDWNRKFRDKKLERASRRSQRLLTLKAGRAQAPGE